MTKLVLQSFGKESEYKRAILTILSYYSQNSGPIERTRVILFTDNPAFFHTYVKGVPIDYVLLIPEKVKQMRGKINFLHRMKIALIEEAFGLGEGNMIYADSDTFFIADPAPLLKELSPEKSFMHVQEYPFENMRNQPLPAGQTARAFLELIESKAFFLTDGSEIRFTPAHVSWNAGVIMFHPAHARFIPDVYSLTDQFYPPTLSHASEQFAFSLIMQERTRVEACDSVIYHYWYRTKKQIMDLFLAGKLNDNWAQLSLAKKLNQVKEWCAIMPLYFDDHVLMIKDHAIQAFNENRFKDGHSYALKALSKTPFDINFIKDVFYHTKRWIKI